MMHRRRMLIALAAAVLFPTGAHSTPVEITVYKSESCGCCAKWVEHMQKHGFRVIARNVDDLAAVKAKHGVPAALGSCHTAIVGRYVIEGHVPADVVQRLLVEKPTNVKGLAVPGMPPGSPGMESPTPQRYEVVAFDTRGGARVYARR